MDLISRKAAIYRLNATPPGNWSKVRYTRELWNVPSVPAVPLDKLCELLDKYNVTVPCNDDCEGCEAFDGTGDTVNCWKVTLAKWMEEQDAKEKT